MKKISSPFKGMQSPLKDYKWTLKSLFKNDEVGVWYDISNSTGMSKNATGE